MHDFLCIFYIVVHFTNTDMCGLGFHTFPISYINCRGGGNSNSGSEERRCHRSQPSLKVHILQSVFVTFITL
jgi:hypothetical protein